MMDLTIEEPEERKQRGKRGRMAYYDEDESNTKENNLQEHKPIQPPLNMDITQRYEVYWTHVSGKAIQATYKVTLDIDSHLMVLDVMDLAVKELKKQVKDTAGKIVLDVSIAKWEIRFVGKDGLPRYDYPCKA